MFLLCLFLNAQDKSMHKYVIENLAEQIVSSSESSVDIETVVSDLEYYYENPLNINTATDKELQQLWVLSYFQIHSLLKYIHQSGSIYSVYELLYVDGFNNVVINQLTPFIKIEAPQKIEKQTLPDIIKNSNNNIYIKATSVIEQQQGYKSFDDSISNKYLGNRMALYTQYQMNYKKQMHSYNFV